METEESSKRPLRLFKYFSAARLDVLRDNRIRFTPPAELNDPFEMVPHVDVSKSEFERMCDENFAKIYALLPLYHPNSKLPSYREWKEKVVKPCRPHAIAELHNYFGEFLEILPRHLQVDLGEKCGLLCLSENHESLLMWAHYTAGHSGFVLEFDALKEPFSRGCLRVTYSAERPVWKQGDQENSWRLLSTKSPEWDYEREHRVIRPIEELEPYPLAGNTSEKKIGHFAALPEDAIKAVYIGCRMQDGVVSELRSISNRPTYQDVQVFIALPSRDRFSLQFHAPDQLTAISPSVRASLSKVFGKDYGGVRSKT